MRKFRDTEFLFFIPKAEAGSVMECVEKGYANIQTMYEYSGWNDIIMEPVCNYSKREIGVNFYRVSGNK